MTESVTLTPTGFRAILRNHRGDATDATITNVENAFRRGEQPGRPEPRKGSLDRSTELRGPQEGSLERSTSSAMPPVGLRFAQRASWCSPVQERLHTRIRDPQAGLHPNAPCLPPAASPCSRCSPWLLRECKTRPARSSHRARCIRSIRWRLFPPAPRLRYGTMTVISAG